MTSKQVVIFEGPDGSGKTTTARAYATATGARYVHFPALRNVNHGLARLYVEAMLPAILGHQDVVLDRCWLSETPYGTAFRGGADRLTVASRRMLERLALRCGAIVVRCEPPWEVVRATYCSRKHLEMLDNEQQLRQVYDLYKVEPTALDMVVHDYTENTATSIQTVVQSMAAVELHHPLSVASAGFLQAPVLLVGEAFTEHRDQDSLYQWPFASFDSGDDSQWLTQQLDEAGISENQLLWVNKDQPLQDLEWVAYLNDYKVFALGSGAKTTLTHLGIAHTAVTNPRAWKCFHPDQPYPLINLLKEALK